VSYNEEGVAYLVSRVATTCPKLIDARGDDLAKDGHGNVRAESAHELMTECETVMGQCLVRIWEPSCHPTPVKEWWDKKREEDGAEGKA